jgi:hypothetical protein
VDPVHQPEQRVSRRLIVSLALPVLVPAPIDGSTRASTARQFTPGLAAGITLAHRH